MEIKVSEIMLDKQYEHYLNSCLYGDNNGKDQIMVSRKFIINAMWRDHELLRLRKIYEKNKAVIEGNEIKEEMGL